MLLSSVVLIVDAGGIKIVDILVGFCDYCDYVSMIANLISSRTRIATPLLCLLGLSLHVMV